MTRSSILFSKVILAAMLRLDEGEQAGAEARRPVRGLLWSSS